MSRNTVRKYLSSGDVEPSYPKRKTPSKLDAYEAPLRCWLQRESFLAVSRIGRSCYLDPQRLEMGVDTFRYLLALRQVVLLFLPDFMETLHRLFSSVEHRCLVVSQRVV